MPNVNRNNNGNGNPVRGNRNPTNQIPIPPPSIVTANLLLQLESIDWNGIGTWNDRLGGGTQMTNTGATKSGDFVSITSAAGDNGAHFVSNQAINFGTNNMTVSLWVNHDAFLTSQSRTIDASNGGNFPGGFLFMFQNNTAQGYAYDSTGGFTASIYNATVDTDVWALWTLVVDFSTGSILYKNGVEVANGGGTTAESIATPTDWWLGTSSEGYPNGTDGLIGQLLAYNRALSPSEVLQNFNATKATYGL